MILFMWNVQPIHSDRAIDPQLLGEEKLGYKSFLGNDENVLTSVFSDGYTALNIPKKKKKTKKALSCVFVNSCLRVCDNIWTNFCV